MKSSNDTLIDAFLDKVRKSILRARRERLAPVVCMLLDQNEEQVSNAVIVPAALLAPPDGAEREESKAHCLPDDSSACQDEDDDTTSTDDAILRVLDESDKPLKISTIASRAKCTFNSHFRKRVRVLVRKGVLKVVDECYYWLTERVS